jgi:hypothetical protein
MKLSYAHINMRAHLPKSDEQRIAELEKELEAYKLQEAYLLARLKKAEGVKQVG